MMSVVNGSKFGSVLNVLVLLMLVLSRCDGFVSRSDNSFLAFTYSTGYSRATTQQQQQKTTSSLHLSPITSKNSLLFQQKQHWNNKFLPSLHRKESTSQLTTNLPIGSTDDSTALLSSSSSEITSSKNGNWLSRVLPPKNELQKLVPLALMFFCILFSYTILRDTKDVLMVTAPKSGAEVIPFIKTYCNLPIAIVS